MVDVVTKIGFEVDAASVSAVKAATAQVQTDMAKAGSVDPFAKLLTTFQEMAEATRNPVVAVEILREELAKLNASDADIERVTASFLEQSAALAEARENALGLEAALARDAQAAADLDAQLAAKMAARQGPTDFEKALAENAAPLDANERFSQVSQGVGLAGDAGSALRTIGGAAGNAGLGGVAGLAGAGAEVLDLVEAVPRLKVALAGLPQVFSAAGEALGLVSGASTAVTAAEAAQTAATATLGTASGGATVGIGAMVVSLGPIAVIGAAVAAALAGIAIAAKLASDEINKANAAYKAQFDAMREVDAMIVSGTTTEEAKKRAETLNRTVESEQRALAIAQKAYDDGFKQLQNSVPIIGDIIARIADLFGAFSGPKAAIDETKKSLDKDTLAQKALNDAVEKNAFAENDAKVAQETAAKTVTQSQKTVVQETQKSQTAQVSAVQEAASQIEQAAQKQKDAANKLGEAQQAANQKAADAAKDAGTKLAQAQTDAQTKYNRDLVDLSIKAAQTRRETEIKSAEDAQKTQRDNARAQQKILADGATQENAALKGRNFLAAAQARENSQQALQDQATSAAQAAAEKQIADAQEKQKIDRDLDEQRQSRRTAMQRQSEDLKIGYGRDLAAARENKARALRDAQLAYQKEIDLATQSKDTILGIKASQAAGEAAIASGDTAALRGAGGSGGGGGTTINDHRSFTGFTGSFGGLVPLEQMRKTMLGTMSKLGY